MIKDERTVSPKVASKTNEGKWWITEGVQHSCKGRGRLRTFYHMHFILSPCVRLYLGRHHSRDAGPLYIMPVSCNDRINFVLIVVYQSKIGQTHYLH